jgi:hypothetical protein
MRLVYYCLFKIFLRIRHTVILCKQPYRTKVLCAQQYIRHIDFRSLEIEFSNFIKIT